MTYERFEKTSINQKDKKTINNNEKTPETITPDKMGDLMDKTIKMVKKTHGIKLPGMDEIIEITKDIHKGKTIGATLVDITLNYNQVTQAINILAWLGHYSSENNISHQLVEKSTQLLKAGNKIESDDAWQAALNLKIFEAIADGVAEIKELLTTRIAQISHLVEQMSPLVLSNHFMSTIYSELTKTNQLPLNFDDANNKLLAAAKFGDIAGIQNAVHFGANVNAKDKLGLTPVDQAIISNKIDATRLLIAKGSYSQLQTRSVPGGPALHWVARHGSVEMLKFLMEAGLPPNERDANGLTAIDHAILNKKVEAATLLYRYCVSSELTRLKKALSATMVATNSAPCDFESAILGAPFSCIETMLNEESLWSRPLNANIIKDARNRNPLLVEYLAYRLLHDRAPAQDALHVAATYGFHETVDCAYKTGWNLELKPGTLPTALTCALAYNCVPMAAALYRHAVKTTPEQCNIMSKMGIIPSVNKSPSVSIINIQPAPKNQFLFNPPAGALNKNRLFKIATPTPIHNKPQKPPVFDGIACHNQAVKAHYALMDRVNNTPPSYTPGPSASEHIARQQEQQRKEKEAFQKREQDMRANSKRSLDLLLSMDECKNGGKGGYITPQSSNSLKITVHPGECWGGKANTAFK